MKKKLIALLLVLAMMVSICPMAFAEETEEDPYWYYDKNDDLLDDYYDVLYSEDYDYVYSHEWYAEMAAIYAQMLRCRALIAADYGYDNYAQNCYREIYARDYTPEGIEDFQSAVKKYIVPLYEDLCELADDLGYSTKKGVFAKDYTGDVALDAIADYIAAMSSELKVSFDYMREYGMYDLAQSKDKSYYGAYTTYLYTYGTPYVFSGVDSPKDGLYTFSTAVHEFGHFNADYYNEGMGFFDNYKFTDVAEVHSQGLELLMTYYYPQLFGEEAVYAYVEQMITFLSTLMYNTLLDEFETYAYTLDVDQYTDEQIVKLLGEKYVALNEVYYSYYTPYDDLEWTEVGHLFWSPCYVISYATSLAAALNVWLDAQPEDNETAEEAFFDAVDRYLEFCNLPAAYGFLESFEVLGINSPIEADTLAQLAEDLAAVLLAKNGIVLNEITDAPRTTSIMTDYNAGRRTDKTFQQILDNDFDDMLAAINDYETVYALVDEILELRKDPANAAAVEEKVNYITDLYMMALTVYNIADVAKWQNYYNSENGWAAYWYYSDACDDADAAYYELYDVACGVVGKVLESPCGGFLKKILSEDDQAWYIEYGIYMYGVDETEDEPEEDEPVTVKPTKPGTGAVKPTVTEPENPFTDVSEKAAYYDAVLYVYEHDLMDGTGNGKFSPDSTLTRGMVVTILHRLEGTPEVAYTGAFTDVASGVWYTGGVEWAVEHDIVNGYGNGKFGPENPVTREQLATMLYRYAEYKGYDLTASADLAGYADGAKTSSYAEAAVAWAAANGILESARNALRPAEKATRAEVAVAVAAFHETFVK